MADRSQSEVTKQQEKSAANFHKISRTLTRHTSWNYHRKLLPETWRVWLAPEFIQTTGSSSDGNANKLNKPRCRQPVIGKKRLLSFEQRDSTNKNPCWGFRFVQIIESYNPLEETTKQELLPWQPWANTMKIPICGRVRKKMNSKNADERQKYGCKNRQTNGIANMTNWLGKTRQQRHIHLEPEMNSPYELESV